MFKKMQEDKKKRGMPQASADEAVREAPGLRVGRDAWKWPPVWPYDESLFQVMADTKKVEAPQKQDLEQIASMLSGVQKVPDMAGTNGKSEEEEEEEQEKFKPLEYWTSPDAIEGLDSDAQDKLKGHLGYYLKEGMSVLELGASSDSYLPDYLSLSRHVGVGANQAAMDRNSRLTESLVVDLNKAVPGRDVDNDDLRRLAQEPFDAIIMTDTIDYLTFPREVFRSAWYLLKPGGTMFVSFSGKSKDNEDAQTGIWTQYNDDQHLWMAGSFFHFSAGDGWEQLLGFDISPETAKDASANAIESIFDKGKANNIYIVQATKGFQDTDINPENLEQSIGSLCWMLPVMEDRDKNLVVPRLARIYESTSHSGIHEAVKRNIPNLPKVYEALSKMDAFSFTFSMQAQMAADLISDPCFTASDEQLLQLRQGLGLRTPSPEVWVPIGQNTANMDVQDRISLLAYIVPRFGSDDPAQDAALQGFVEGLKPTYSVIRRKCPDWSAADVELMGTELLATEILTVGRSTREEFATWLGDLRATELETLLATRKSLQQSAKTELEKFKKDQAEEAEALAEYKRKYDEQIQTARQERSMYFNARTQKMELMEKKK